VHTMPPTGGFGGNTGVADSHNLAWKLAAVLGGSAGEALLESYDAERRPVASFVAEQAYARYVLRIDPALGTDDIQPFVPDPPIQLGYRYRSSAILSEEDGDPGIYEDPNEPSGRPGTRAPHVVLERDGRELSSLDLLGRRFVVLAGPGGEASRSTPTASAPTSETATVSFWLATASSPTARRSSGRTASSPGARAQRRRTRLARSPTRWRTCCLAREG
jgi:hypothetical protein